VRIYIDASAAKRQAVTNFMKAALADWGKLEAVKAASVRMTKTGARHSLFVDKGLTALLEMKPVVGGDNVTPVAHNNLASPLHSLLFQGATTSASFSDSHPFKLAGSNGFFNDRCVMRGRL
jgi:hypothetical protein